MTYHNVIIPHLQDGFRLNFMDLPSLSQEIHFPKTWRYEDEIDYDGDTLILKVLKIRDKHVITKDGTQVKL